MDVVDNLDEKELLKLRNWLICFTVVKFDIDDGQVIETVYPPHNLSKSELKLLSLLSFPDSNSFMNCEGNIKYIYRLKREKIKENSEPFSFAFVYFQQRKDPTLARGYFQKSIVIVTNNPFLNFYLNLANVVGSMYFGINKQNNLFEVACHSIASWPDPSPGQSYELPFLGCLLQVEIPLHFTMSVEDLNVAKNLTLNINDKEDKNAVKNGEGVKMTTPTKKITIVFDKDPASISDVASSSAKKEDSENFGKNGFDSENEKYSENYKGMPQATSDFSEDSKEIQHKIEDQNKEIIQNKNLSHIAQLRKKNSSTNNNLTNLLTSANLQEKGQFQDINIFEVLGSKVSHLWKIWEIVLTNEPLLVVADSPTISSQAVLGIVSLISPLSYAGDYRPYFTIYDPDYKHYQMEQEQKQIKNVLLGVTNPLFIKTMKKFPILLHLESEYEEAQKIKIKGELLKSDKTVNYLESQMKFLVESDKEMMKLLLPVDTKETAAINNTLVRKSFRALTCSFLKVFEEYISQQTNDIKTFDEKTFLKMLSSYKFNFPQGLFAKRTRTIKLYQKFLRSANFISYIKNLNNVYFAKKNILV